MIESPVTTRTAQTISNKVNPALELDSFMRPLSVAILRLKPYTTPVGTVVAATRLVMCKSRAVVAL